MKLNDISIAAIALLLAFGILVLLSSPAMAQGPPVDSYDCTEMQADAAKECQGENEDQDNGDDSGEEFPSVQEIDLDNDEEHCVSDLWSIISGNATSCS